VPSALGQAPFTCQFHSHGDAPKLSVLSLSGSSSQPNTHLPRPLHGRRPSYALDLFLFATLVLAAALQSGCTGITSAKGTSTASAANSTTSAALTASPAALNFGNVSMGSPSNQSLTLTNSGTSAVTISQASVSGGGLSLSGVALPVSLNPGDSATFTATFVPSTAGDVSGSVSFLSPQLRQNFGVGWHGTGKAVAPLISVQPVSQSILAGQTATFSVTANGTSPLSYQWSKNGTAISGGTSASYTTPAETSSDNGAQFSVVVSNSVGSGTSNIATLSVTTAPVPPSITAQPANQTIFANQTATFSVIANGTAPLSYQWRKNGAAISGATSASYTTSAETTSDNGALFSVVVSNSAGNAISNNATLTVNPDPVAPSITSQPASVTITAGQTATFSVTASGTAPLSYQWQKNGAAISGATSSSYATPAETTSDNGAQFSVVVSNSVGSATSNTTTLTVNPAPVAPSITTQPPSQTITAGQTATFSVTANGTSPLSYQWSKNGAAISGATASSYTTPAETTSDNGAQFSVVVSNSVGSATSNVATLTVTTPAQLSSTVLSLSFLNINVGSSSTQSVTLTNTGGSNVSISTVTVSGAGFSVNGISTGLILSPSAGVTMNVVFAPAASGSVTGAVTITSNAANSPLTISVSGTGLAVTHSAVLSWTASTSTVVGYNVYRGSVSGGPYTKLTSSLDASTTFTDSSVLSGQTYFYVVTAVDSNNLESVDSNEATALIP
jgi:Abnormal spindle-like microcephaly-assoc'd, ASPM-SPD-2-Hydin/Transmembrane protein 131-like N-terminal/Immunoglobulin I-set domain